ncbi:MAG: GDP-mannose 4,6-dehydratase [Dehalococcoidia bacterium]|nr:GDP-mannose 4,6-dehydratase [Dehalococcoidia bacterium]
MKILVTGAAGLYGVHIVDELVNRKDVSTVYGVDNFSRGFLENDPFIKSPEFESKFKLLRINYQDMDSQFLDNLEVEVIVHFASYVSIDESIDKPAEYFYNNEEGTFKFAHSILKTKAKPFLIYASSPEVYGNPIYTPMDESHPIHPRSTYAVTKLAAEKHCLSLYEWHNYPVAAIRNFNTFGENQNLWGYSGVIPRFIEQALKGEPLTIHGDGKQTRDFMYVKDGVRAYSLFIDKRHKLKGEIFNIGTEKQTSILELANKIKELTKSDSKIVFEKGRPGDLFALHADISKAKKKLGWEPRFTLDQGLGRTIEWYRRFVR